MLTRLVGLSVLLASSLPGQAILESTGTSGMSVYSSDPVCSITAIFLFYNSTGGNLKICDKGTITIVEGVEGGSGTRIPLLASAAVPLDGSTSNDTAVMFRQKGALSGLDPFTLTIRFGINNHAQWTFVIPANFDSAPVLTFWGVGSSAVGTHTFDARIRCATPNNSENWGGAAWDTVNSLASIGFTTFLDTIVITLTNADSMTAGDLCQIDLELQAGPNLFELYAAEINYTES